MRERSVGNNNGTGSSSILVNDGPLASDINSNARYRTNSVTALTKEDAMANFSSALKQEDIESSYGLTSAINQQKPSLSRHTIVQTPSKKQLPH